MDKANTKMDKIGKNLKIPILSNQVSDSRYFFLNLAPKKNAPLTIVAGGRERCNPDYQINRHHFRYHTIEYVAEGHGNIRLNGKRHELCPGTLYTYAPDTRCEINTDPEHPMLKYFVSVQSCNIMHIFKRTGIPPGHVIYLPSHGEIHGIIENLIYEGRQQNGFEKAICTHIFEILLLKIRSNLRSNRKNHSEDNSLKNYHRCKALIDAENEHLHSLNDIAEIIGLDASSICRLFRRYMGTSPYQYLLRKKMNRAASLLLTEGCLIKQAAEQVGFPDPYHFSRCFKAIHGIPPKNLLRSHSKKLEQKL